MGDGSHGEAARAYSQVIPVKYRQLYNRATSNRGAKASAIKAHCQYCVGYCNTVPAIRYCKRLECPMWLHRPYQTKEKTDEGTTQSPTEGSAGT